MVDSSKATVLASLASYHESSDDEDDVERDNDDEGDKSTAAFFIAVSFFLALTVAVHVYTLVNEHCLQKKWKPSRKQERNNKKKRY